MNKSESKANDVNWKSPKALRYKTALENYGLNRSPKKENILDVMKNKDSLQR
jgi:hypothetical protein